MNEMIALLLIACGLILSALRARRHGQQRQREAADSAVFNRLKQQAALKCFETGKVVIGSINDKGEFKIRVIDRNEKEES